MVHCHYGTKKVENDLWALPSLAKYLHQCTLTNAVTKIYCLLMTLISILFLQSKLGDFLKNYCPNAMFQIKTISELISSDRSSHSDELGLQHCSILVQATFWTFSSAYWDWCWAANWDLSIDADWFWLVQTVVDWCRLGLIDADFLLSREKVFLVHTFLEEKQIKEKIWLIDDEKVFHLSQKKYSIWTKKKYFIWPTKKNHLGQKKIHLSQKRRIQFE